MHTLPINKFAMSAHTIQNRRLLFPVRAFVAWCMLLFLFLLFYSVRYSWNAIGCSACAFGMCRALIVSHSESYPTTFCHSPTHSFLFHFIFFKEQFHTLTQFAQPDRQAGKHGTKTVLLIFEQKDRDHTKCTCVIWWRKKTVTHLHTIYLCMCAKLQKCKEKKKNKEKEKNVKWIKQP